MITPCELGVLHAEKNLLSRFNLLAHHLPNLVKLNLKSNRLQGSFPSAAGGGLQLWPALVELELDGNSLSTLNISVFPHLRVCSAARNQLTSICSASEITKNDVAGREHPTGLTATLEYLDTLQLAHNKLQSWPLASTTNKKSSTDVKSLEGGVVANGSIVAPRLSVCILSNNKLRVLPEEMESHAPSLQTLDLQNNDLAQLPFGLGFCTSLKRIVLDGNAIRSIRPQVLQSSADQLKKYLRDRAPAPLLDAQQHVHERREPHEATRMAPYYAQDSFHTADVGGTTIFSGVANDARQQKESFDSNAVASFTHEQQAVPYKCESLSSLFVGRAAGTDRETLEFVDHPDVSGSVGQENFLCQVQLDENAPALGSLRNLAVVKCKWLSSLNDKSATPTALAAGRGCTSSLLRIPGVHLHNLQLLDLSRNFLTALPDVSEVKRLHELRMAQNRITMLDCSHFYERCPQSLRVLDISNNQITTVENAGTFVARGSDVSQIQTLFLHNNSLRDLPVEWGSWELLQSITLEGNILRRYPDARVKGVPFLKKYLRVRAGILD
ncbi:unnamed protein product [Amoebophrya sp. A25]|nr:unnamed protein product [Amoebophrya sp. A25]|eukprot:GSA25T00005131001.1